MKDVKLYESIKALILLKIANVYFNMAERCIERGNIDYAKKCHKIGKAYMLASNPNIFDDKEEQR